jgi:hypothetical protein
MIICDYSFLSFSEIDEFPTRERRNRAIGVLWFASVSPCPFPHPTSTINKEKNRRLYKI